MIIIGNSYRFFYSPVMSHCYYNQKQYSDSIKPVKKQAVVL